MIEGTTREQEQAAAVVPNLLRDAEYTARVAPPCVVVIFGAMGDLTHRKLAPALYNLALANLLPAEYAVLGVGRQEIDDQEFRKQLRAATTTYSRNTPLEAPIWDSLASRLFYMAGDLGELPTYDQIRTRLDEIDRTCGTAGNRLYYLATPPSLFAPIVRSLGAAGLNVGGRLDSFARLCVEKPFGWNLSSARALNKQIWEYFPENEVFRIDHYLGKETALNTMAFRFANRLWEPVWNDRHVELVQMTMAESIGVEGRGKFYDAVGAFRDVVENHMLQLLALTGMEPPVTFDASAVRDERAKLLKALRPMTPPVVARETVRGQYGPGWIGGEAVPNYRSEPGVDPHSLTETFVALRLFVDNWRWAGVPIYLRHGKRLPRRLTEIAVQFKPAPHLPFAPTMTEGLAPDTIVLRIQPDEGITLQFGAKVPGTRMAIRTVNMDFLYGTTFFTEPPEAYERLLLYALQGDPMLFRRADEVEASWGWATPILEAWQEAGEPPHPYPAGTWGPPEANALIERDGHHWRRL